MGGLHPGKSPQVSTSQQKCVVHRHGLYVYANIEILRIDSDDVGSNDQDILLQQEIIHVGGM